MKAEERKQLETNVLADRMGRLVQTIKKGPSRRGVWLWVGVAVVVIVVVIVFFIRSTHYRIDSELWKGVLDQDLRAFLGQNEQGQTDFRGDLRNTPQLKAVRFEMAWKQLWQDGLMPLYSSSLFNQKGKTPSANSNALRNIEFAAQTYEGLYGECKSDPVLGPEALFNIALAKETLAIKDMNNLKEAKKTYEDVTKEYPESSFGKRAAERLKLFKDDKSYREIENFYNTLHEAYGSGAMDLEQILKGLPPEIQENMRKKLKAQK